MKSKRDHFVVVFTWKSGKLVKLEFTDHTHWNTCSSGISCCETQSLMCHLGSNQTQLKGYLGSASDPQWRLFPNSTEALPWDTSPSMQRADRSFAVTLSSSIDIHDRKSKSLVFEICFYCMLKKRIALENFVCMILWLLKSINRSGFFLASPHRSCSVQSCPF